MALVSYFFSYPEFFFSSSREYIFRIILFLQTALFLLLFGQFFSFLWRQMCLSLLICILTCGNFCFILFLFFLYIARLLCSELLLSFYCTHRKQAQHHFRGAKYWQPKWITCRQSHLHITDCIYYISLSNFLIHSTYAAASKESR